MVGADDTANAVDPSAVASAFSRIGGGAHGVLITAPSNAAFSQGIQLALAADRKVFAQVHTSPLERIDEIFNCLTTGTLNGRAVLQMS